MARYVDWANSESARRETREKQTIGLLAKAILRQRGIELSESLKRRLIRKHPALRKALKKTLSDQGSLLKCRIGILRH
jgi:hypothetical protein